uniref:Uncharacterized protein n=1 Tax=Anguilla anguilla TaxID=7936 RepID=A0A0E9QDQ0_ANGAN
MASVRPRRTERNTMSHIQDCVSQKFHVFVKKYCTDVFVLFLIICPWFNLKGERWPPTCVFFCCTKGGVSGHPFSPIHLIQCKMLVLKYIKLQ